MKLYTYFRSSAAYRVRIGLHLKGVAWQPEAVSLTRREHLEDTYRDVNPQRLVPTLEDGDARIGQSLAILEYLDERFPEPPLLPADPAQRARVRQIALAIACEIHPLQNIGAALLLQREFELTDEQRSHWCRLVIGRGLANVEALLAKDPATGRFCHGDAPTLADCVLVPQLYNARRYEVDLGALPTLVRIDATCNELDAFRRAAPEAQPDRPG